MPFNSSGVFQRVRNWVADAAAGIKIRADFHDAEDDGFAAGLTNCICRDGQTIITQNIPFNSKRITGLQDPVNPQDAVTMAWALPKIGGVVTGDFKVTGDIFVGYGTPTGTIRFDNDPGIYLSYNGGVFYFTHGINAPSLDTAGAISTALGLEVGPAAGTAGTGYIDLHSGTAGIDYNARIYVAGGTNGIAFDTKGSRSVFNGPVQVGEPGQGPDAATVNYVNGRTSFTPVQQDGAPGMQGNKVYIGWNGASLIAQVDATALGAFSFGTAVTNARLAFAGDVAAATGPQSATYEPYAGGVMTGWQWAVVVQASPTAFRVRYMQLYTTSWFTIGYV